MALPINIEDLLNKRKIESNRIEFKAGWNPDKIYHTICAFATDLDNIGGGYILVGVEEENGIAKRPVKGLAENEIDRCHLGACRNKPTLFGGRECSCQKINTEILCAK